MSKLKYTLVNTELQESFEQATAAVKQLTAQPDNETLLKLYALYKQAIRGDAQDASSNAVDFVGMAKAQAWKKWKGTTREQAMQLYVQLVNQLKG